MERELLHPMLASNRTYNIIWPFNAGHIKMLKLRPLQVQAGLCRSYSVKEINKRPVDEEKKAKTQNRLHKIISRSRILSKAKENERFAAYFKRLSEAGVTSTVTSFLILHELTAIAPLFGLWWVFYQLDLPDQYELPLYFTNLLNQCGEAMEKLVGNYYSEDLDRNRLILAGAISYALVKALYPVRVLLSLWGAPYVGKWLLSPVSKLRNLMKPKKKSSNKSSK